VHNAAVISKNKYGISEYDKLLRWV